ncbi:MAG: hypothetical protein MK209_05575 [Planctomycetes bacterium]|nr:hypothetical protein [Planctomycetota bacterium]
MLPLFLLITLSRALDVAPALQEPPSPAPKGAEVGDPLAVPVLAYREREIPALEVIQQIAPGEELLQLLRSDPAYRKAYLASPRFVGSVRTYADVLRLNELGIRKAPEEALLSEAKAYGADRKSRLTPSALLRSQPLEIEVRARLISQQSPNFSNDDLRQHMLRSVPEFFGELQVSWIRIPLIDAAAARALTQEETRKVYDHLDKAAHKLQANEISWDEAVEKYSQDPITKPHNGAVGILKRDMTDRFEESMLRTLFADLGFKKLEGELLRGPILAQKWAYLVRIEGSRIDGVPELQRARDRVQRSLREMLLQKQLAGIRQVLPAQVLAPIVG